MDMALNRDNDCIRNALRSLDYAPNNVISRYLLALTYIQQGRIEEAYTYFLKIRNSPAGLLEDVQELDAVIAYCDQFIKENQRTK
jgi:cytochrome c-type biogenesis protein CcmH/NrfG